MTLRRPKPNYLSQNPEMSDHDFAAEQKYQLQVFIQRCMAVTVGRGMYTLNTVRPLITQAIKIPGLILSGKGEQGATISLDDTEMPAGSLPAGRCSIAGMTSAIEPDSLPAPPHRF